MARINKALDWNVVKCSKCGRGVNRDNAQIIDGKPHGPTCAQKVIAIKIKGVKDEGF